MSANRRARQQRPTPQTTTGTQSSATSAAEPQGQPDTTPATTKPRTGAEGKCRVPKCTDEQLQGGVCTRHFLEGRHVR